MLLTASSDFVLRSLSNVQTVIGKILYCAQLLNRDGEYVHWGLTKMYGASAVQEAVASSHRDLLHAWLTLRMPEIIDDFALFSEVKGIRSDEAVAQIKSLLLFLPPNAQRDLALHCSVYLETLEALTQREHSAAA